MADINLLVLNPGSTSTKISIFENGTEIERKDLSHSVEELGKFEKATDEDTHPLKIMASIPSAVTSATGHFPQMYSTHITPTMIRAITDKGIPLPLLLRGIRHRFFLSRTGKTKRIRTRFGPVIFRRLDPQKSGPVVQ